VLVPLVIQPKLTIGSPDDEYEKEADTLAEQVMSFREPQAAGVSGSDDDQNSHSKLNGKPIDSRLSRQAMLRRLPIRKLQKTVRNRALARLLAETSPMPAVSEICRKCACGVEAEEAEEECSECRRGRVALQRSSVSVEAGVEAPPIVESVLGTPGQPLAQSARKTLEPRFGHDFSEVRVHDDSQAAESASAVTALAYAVGNHIVFGAGQYAPGTNEVNRLLSHELTHSIQQTAGRPNVFRGAASEETGANAAAVDFEEKGQVGAEVVSSGPAAEVGMPSDSKGVAADRRFRATFQCCQSSSK
jgi:hypothetical protein